MAALSSIRTLSRTKVIILVFPPFSGSISRRTFEPFFPLILSTTSSKRQPITSSIGPLSPCPTPTILSFTAIRLLRAAGAPGTSDLIVVTSSSIESVAPIPSKERFILSWKAFAERGDKKLVCGSISSANEFK